MRYGIFFIISNWKYINDEKNYADAKNMMEQKEHIGKCVIPYAKNQNYIMWATKETSVPTP